MHSRRRLSIGIEAASRHIPFSLDAAAAAVARGRSALRPRLRFGPGRRFSRTITSAAGAIATRCKKSGCNASAMRARPQLRYHATCYWSHDEEVDALRYFTLMLAPPIEAAMHGAWRAEATHDDLRRFFSPLSQLTSRWSQRQATYAAAHASLRQDIFTRAAMMRARFATHFIPCSKTKNIAVIIFANDSRVRASTAPRAPPLSSPAPPPPLVSG